MGLLISASGKFLSKKGDIAMGYPLKTKYIKTILGTLKISIRSGKTLLVFLNGYGLYDAAQVFTPIIQKVSSEVGVMAVDYLDSGLSSNSTRSFVFTEEADLITKIIQEQNAKRVIVVAHSIGGLYALYLAQKLNNVAGFVGIEPTTKEILLSPPNEAAYIAEQEEHKNATEADINSMMHEKIYTSFPKNLADQIWTTAADSERKGKTNNQDHGLDLALSSSILEKREYSNLKLAKTIPSFVFVRPYRVAEYKRSEYCTENTTVIPLGESHYIHFEFPAEISQAIQRLLAMKTS